MKLILQRVSSASVFIDKEQVSSIDKGILVLFCAEKEDGEKQVNFLADKTLNLRIFGDDRGKIHFSCLDIGGDILVVPQFTIAGDCSHGRRPSFDQAANPDIAKALYKDFIKLLTQSGLKIGFGEFAADMKVHLVNDGPVTFLLEH